VSCKGIVFDKVTIACQPHCDYRSPGDPAKEKMIRHEEDEWNAMETIGRLVVRKWPETPSAWVGTDAVKTWQNYLMHLLKPLCRHYDVNPSTVHNMFVRHYMPSILLSDKHATPEGSEPLVLQMLDSMQRKAKYPREEVDKMGLPEKEAQERLRENADENL
jgi:hypothetical protein